MANRKALKSISKDLIEFGRSAPPLQAYNRQLLQALVNALGARAATLWIVREDQLLMADQVEQRKGTVDSLQTDEESQQAAIKRCYERQESIMFQEAIAGSETENLIFVPVADIEGVLGVVRIWLGQMAPEDMQKATQVCELICGYYSLYSAHRMLSGHEEEREEIDRASKAILQLQHYAFSNHLPEVAVNSAVEVAPIDRAVLLTRQKQGAELEVTGVSSAVESATESAWTRLCSELGGAVLEFGEPVFCSPKKGAEEIEDDELREKVNSYLLMTDASLLMIFPLVSGNDSMGVLMLERFDDYEPSQMEWNACSIYAAHTASALGNHRIFNSLPFHNFYAKKLEKEEEEVGRRPLKIGKAVKTVVFVAILGAITYFGGFYPVEEKISADCFVAPFQNRILTASIAGEVEQVHFEQGEFVGQGDPLIQFRTEDILLQLGRERENAKNIRAEIAQIRGRIEDERRPEHRGRLLAEIRALQHSYNAKLKEIEILANRLEASRITAPIDGIMMEPEDPDELIGITVTEGERLARIGSVHENVKIQIAVPSNRTAEVEKGMGARISLQPLLGEKDIKTEIGRIADRSVNYEDSNVFMATAMVPNTGAGNAPVLKAGMTGKARIVIPEKTNYFSIYGRRIWRRLHYWFF